MLRGAPSPSRALIRFVREDRTLVETMLRVFAGNANRPLAVAPYMGENAFIAFGLTALGIGFDHCARPQR